MIPGNRPAPPQCGNGGVTELLMVLTDLIDFQ